MALPVARAAVPDAGDRPQGALAPLQGHARGVPRQRRLRDDVVLVRVRRRWASIPRFPAPTSSSSEARCSRGPSSTMPAGDLTIEAPQAGPAQPVRPGSDPERATRPALRGRASRSWRVDGCTSRSPANRTRPGAPTPPTLPRRSRRASPTRPPAAEDGPPSLWRGPPSSPPLRWSRASVTYGLTRDLVGSPGRAVSPAVSCPHLYVGVVRVRRCDARVVIHADPQVRRNA